MKFVFHTNSVSPHQLPLALEIVRLLGVEEFRYIYTTSRTDERRQLGWNDETAEWVIYERDDLETCRVWIEGCETLMSGIREIDVFEKRAVAGLNTIYTSERWFKPGIGILRVLKPSYFKMACRFVKLLSGDNKMYYFPIGVHAARDMARLCGLFAGDLRCLFRAPKLDFESKPGGKIWLKNGGDDKRYCLDKMRMWGYFVEPSQLTHSPTPNSPTIKVLWVGRFLKLKRVDTIIRAVGELSKSHSSTPQLTHSPTPNSPTHPLTLALYGTGPEENRLKKLASKYGDVIKFYPPVPIADVRRLMREHDVYVLSSNAYEGWGAVVSEALEEGMKVVGTYEAGASATVLPNKNLFHAGDWRGLRRLLANDVICCGIGSWIAEGAARALFKSDGTLVI